MRPEDRHPGGHICEEPPDESVALRPLIDSETHAAFVIAIVGTVLAWNDIAATLFRVPRRQALGVSFTALGLDAHVPEVMQIVERVVRTGESTDLRGTLVSQAGGRLMVSIRGGPVFRPDRTLLGVVVHVDAPTPAPGAVGRPREDPTDDDRDTIVDTVVSEFDACLRALDTARAAHQEKAEALALVNHELRAPLHTIVCTLPLLRARATADEALRDACAIVERQVGYVARLLDDLLGAGPPGRRVRQATVRFQDAVRDAIELVEDLIRTRRHALAVTLASEPLWVRADPVHLTQIAANLLGNAAKFTEPGGRISVDLRREGAAATLMVTDTGIGISEALLPEVFAPFVRGGGGAASPGSYGLGLSLARRLVEQHGGSIAVQSDGPGRGASFIVRFPVAA